MFSIIIIHYHIIWILLAISSTNQPSSIIPNWLVVWNINFIFPIILGIIIIPTDFKSIIFQRGRLNHQPAKTRSPFLWTRAWSLSRKPFGASGGAARAFRARTLRTWRPLGPGRDHGKIHGKNDHFLIGELIKWSICWFFTSMLVYRRLSEV